MHIYRAFIGVQMMFCISIALVSTAYGASSVQFHGTLIAVSCKINAGNRKVVNFGDSIGIHRIDGKKRYEQTIPFILECVNHSKNSLPAMTLTLSGTPALYNNAAIITDTDGLAIELRVNGKAQPINKPINLDYNKQPVLTAIPVVKPNIELKPVDFTATMKIVVEMQ